MTSSPVPLGGKDEETEDYENQLIGMQGCRKGSDHLTLKTKN